MGVSGRRPEAIVICGMFVLAAAATKAAVAQAPPPIRDNSFLVEEAYNQEQGVVQHISNFVRFREERDWVYTFTQEWPFLTQKHQLSFTFPVEDPGSRAPGSAGVGDLALNYRYQALGGGEERIAFSPRLSLLLPTGDETEDRGVGAAGVQVNLPLSMEISPSFVAHSNLGSTHVPSARNGAGDEAGATAFHLGQSVIWLARPALNVMLEAAWASEEEVVGPERTSRGSSFFLAPGVRWAHNLASGLQIVPGVAVPIGLGNSRGDGAVLLYLSFEHPYRQRDSPRK